MVLRMKELSGWFDGSSGALLMNSVACIAQRDHVACRVYSNRATSRSITMLFLYS